jgi:hypothetical protein
MIYLLYGNRTNVVYLDQRVTTRETLNTLSAVHGTVHGGIMILD